MFRGPAVLAMAFLPLVADPLPQDLAARIAAFAAEFHTKAPLAIAQETLVQRSYGPPHTGFAIGAAAEPTRSFYRVHEVVSEYSFGSLPGDTARKLLEFREILERDGSPAQTSAAARKALATAISAGEERLRKKILTEFTALGLVDVATDYGPILLEFTAAGQPNLDMSVVGAAMLGVDRALVIEWRERSGGAIEYRGRKQARRLLHGTLWVRADDGMPLRVTASFEHEEPKHVLRDDATIEYARATFGAPMPVSVVHRHLVDGVVLTENLYTYGPFRLFGSDSTIRFGGPVAPPAK